MDATPCSAAFSDPAEDRSTVVRPCLTVSRGQLFEDFFFGLGFYYLTSLPVALGLLFGDDFVRPNDARLSLQASSDLAAACIRFDGYHYLDIVSNGYKYDPLQRSTVAFFPAYPLFAWLWVRIPGIRPEVALLLASNISLAAAFVVLARYVRIRVPAVPSNHAAWILLAFGLWPTTFFFRMAYAESTFLCWALLTLYGIARRWPLVSVAFLAGLTTATRPIGVAATAAFLWYSLGQSGSILIRFGRTAVLAPLACWGLLAYMGYQYAAFGNPLGFAQTQENWTYQNPQTYPELKDKLWSLGTLEPIWGVYDPRSERFWGRADAEQNVFFSLRFWNPILFLLAVGLMVFGTWRRWLTGPEVVLGAVLLAIPYLTRSYEMSMASHGRFAAVVVGNYLILGRLLASAPSSAASIAISLSAVFLACWTALYTAAYLFF